MTRTAIKAPNPAEQLFEGLFQDRDRDKTIRLISEGLHAILANAKRLIEDVAYLLDAGRHASARFLLTTAEEEMAKAYILLDACRLDFAKHQSTLKQLCRAFYDHYKKHAYKEIVQFYSVELYEDPGQVKKLWDGEVQRWYPAPLTVLDGDPMQDEPDFPHPTVWYREMPLYVDLAASDGDWMVPSNASERILFEFGLDDGGWATDPMSQARAAHERLHATEEAGLFGSECLSILNGQFSTRYVSERARPVDIGKLYEAVAKRIEAERGISPESFWPSALVTYPLYGFLETRRSRASAEV